MVRPGRRDAPDRYARPGRLAGHRPAAVSSPAHRLILASASPARLALLRAAGFDPEVRVSGVDESGVPGTPPQVAAELARRKAGAVAAVAGTGALVLGCDSLLELDGTAHGKPAGTDEARAQWARMAGRTGVLHTGHHLVDTSTGTGAGATASTLVRFGRPTAAELEAYLRTGEPLRVAGAFTLDGRGGIFVDGVDGDPGTVVGLSLSTFRRLLAELDVRATDLWT